MEKIKCYTMENNGSKLVDPNIENVLETLKQELENNINHEDEPIQFVFDIEYHTQEELDQLGEFDGF